MAKECEHDMQFVGTYHWLGGPLMGRWHLHAVLERVYGDAYVCSNARTEGS